MKSPLISSIVAFGHVNLKVILLVLFGFGPLECGLGAGHVMLSPSRLRLKIIYCIVSQSAIGSMGQLLYERLSSINFSLSCHMIYMIIDPT